MLFGAPLYPFFAERVMPPFIAEIQGTRAHPPVVPLRYMMPVLPAMILLATESVRRLGARLPSALFVKRALIIAAALVTIPGLRVAGTRALEPTPRSGRARTRTPRGRAQRRGAVPRGQVVQR